MPSFTFKNNKGKDETMEFDTGNDVANGLIKKYCDDNIVHTTFLVTYGQLFSKVWKRIIRHEKKDELIGRLIQELGDGQGMCYTGRVGRLVNTLHGYYDDIKMNISDNDQISAKISAAKNYILKKGEITEVDEDFSRQWYELAKSYLEEVMDTSDEEQKTNMYEWLSYIGYTPEDESGSGGGGDDDDVEMTEESKTDEEGVRAGSEGNIGDGSGEIIADSTVEASADIEVTE